MSRHTYILIPEPKVEVRELYGLQDFYDKLLSATEQKLWDLFVFYHFPIEKICEITGLSRRSISWRIRRISNKVWFFASKDLVQFYLANAGYRRKITWKPYPKVFTAKQKLMHQRKQRGVRRFVNVNLLEQFRTQEPQTSSEESTQ